MSFKKYLAPVIAIVFLGAAYSAFLWLKAEHRSTEAIRVARAFVDHLQARQFVQAHELSMKNSYVGKTAGELEKISAHEMCSLDDTTETFPFQSNGNRLRRWLSGNEIEMPELHVEFKGSCLLGVTLRRSPDRQWRVFKFASHAG
jgi:hypothetical protein